MSAANIIPVSAAVLGRAASQVLLVGHLFHPRDVRAVERLLDGDMGHGGSRRRTVPVPPIGGAQQDVAFSEFLDWTILHLGPAHTSDNDERLSKWMRVPGRARSR